MSARGRICVGIQPRDVQGDVAGRKLHGRNCDDETDDAKAEGDRDMPEPFARAVRVSAHDERDDGGEHPRRCAKEESNRGVVAHRSAERREERVEREGDDQAGESEREPPNFPVSESHAEAVEPSASLGRGIIADTDIFLHTLLSKADFLGAQPGVRSGGEVGEDEDGKDCDEHRERTLDEEEPPIQDVWLPPEYRRLCGILPPGSMSQFALHTVQDARGNQRAEGITD